jgi:hypothetical protein
VSERPDLDLLHTRNYDVQSFRIDASSMLLRGEVRDRKPAGLYVDDDPEPLTIHHMIVELTVSFPMLEITAAEVVFETHPHTTCPRITDHYGNLVGLSIARGFTHRVRELFGGPRGCTHTTALLQAMAPVAIQSTWSMARGEPITVMSPEMRKAAMARNLNTCHVWDEDGEQVASILAGEQMEPPLWIVDRLTALGRDPSTWRDRLGS